MHDVAGTIRSPGLVVRVLAIGVFDLFHIGHLRYLQFARRHGDVLSVAVTTDAIALAVKGKSPVIPEDQRLEIIRGLGWVDAARLQPTSTEDTGVAASWISAWGVTHVIPGGCWEGSARWTRLTPVLAERGIQVRFAPHTPGVSTTEIVTSILNGDMARMGKVTAV